MPFIYFGEVTFLSFCAMLGCQFFAIKAKCWFEIVFDDAVPQNELLDVLDIVFLLQKSYAHFELCLTSLDGIQLIN